jgi:carboxyl-terminal processing protease
MMPLPGLRKTTCKNIVLDLRGNGGGYMLAATALLINFSRIRTCWSTSQEGKHQGRTINQTDQVAWHRTGLLFLQMNNLLQQVKSWQEHFRIGTGDRNRQKRTFGKGLVQNGFYLTDGSMIRLTIARYYTPSGRSIQSAYDEGYDKYMENYVKRFTDGEMMTADSIHLLILLNS